MFSLKNCINKHFYNDKVEENVNIKTTPLKHKRKISSDSEEIPVKIPFTSTSQTNDSFTPNAESTKIISNDLPNSASYSDEHEQIVQELSLEDIDFEEPITPKENESDFLTGSQNNEVKKIDDMAEYRKRLMNIRKHIPSQTIQSDDTNVINFNADHITISQWSKGNVILNEKSLEVFCYTLY